MYCIVLAFVVLTVSTAQQIYPDELSLLDASFSGENTYHDLSYLNSELSLDKHHRFQARRGTYKANKDSCDHIQKLPYTVRAELRLSYFYQKYTHAFGIPVLGSNRVTNSALKRACYELRFYLANNDALKSEFYRKKLRIVLIGNDDTIDRLPEFKSLPNEWSKLRGLSARAAIPIIAVSEGNVDCLSDEAGSLDLMFHELSYSAVSMSALDTSKLLKLNSLYERAVKVVPWKQTFALLDVKEYFASAVDVYYNASEAKYFTLQDLKSHDTELVQFIDEIIPCNYEYLHRCDSSREREHSQQLAKDCSSRMLTTTKPTTTRIATTSATTTTKLTTTTTTPTTTTSGTTRLTFRPLSYVRTTLIEGR